MVDPNVHCQQIDHAADKNRAEDAHYITGIGIPDEADMYTHSIHHDGRNGTIQASKNKEIPS